MKRLFFLFLIVLFQITFSYPRILYSQNVKRTGVSQSDVQVLQNIAESLYGSNHSVTGVINIDKAIGNLFVSNGGITDPYNTLAGLYIYCAVGLKSNSINNHKGFIGIAKDGQDYWHLDTLIYDSEITNGYTYSTRDLNNDGKVEIITNWSYSSEWPNYLWIFSWDGQIGECINAVDENGQSVIWSDYFEGFEFPDVDGDGILEIQGWRDQGEGDPVTYSWNGQLYGNWPNTPQPPKGFVLPRNRVDKELRAKVEKTSDGYKYQYTVKIESTSIQDVNQILVECEINSIQKAFSRKGWIFRLWDNLLGWTNSSQPQTENLLLAGQIDSSFVYVSLGLPKILYYYVRGYNSDQVSFKNLMENSASGLTIGAANPPDPFSAVGFSDSLIHNCVMSDSLIWITDSVVTEKYTGYFENTKSHIQQNNNSAAIGVLDSVLTDVKADSGVTLTSEAYALIKYNTEYLKEQLTQPHGLPHNVRLLNSQGQLLIGGNLQFYDGGWKAAINNGDGTFLVEIERSTVSLRMSYEGGNETRQNVPIQGAVVTFQTVNSKIELRNSQNQLIDEGTVQYYAGGWRDFGATTGGVASKELLPLQYSFRMTYAHAGIDKQQNIGQDSAVVFQTVAARVELRNSTDNLIDQGSVQYYAGAWREFGTTSGGIATKELLPKQYSFRMSYAYASIDKQQDIGSDPTIVFQTVNAQVELRNSTGNLIDEGSVQYYAGAWREFGTTSGGVASMELLPKQYSFRMTYAYASIDRQQDISGDLVVSFATVLATINVTGQQNQPLNGAQVSYYSGAWRSIGEAVNGSIAKELLPRNYTFRAVYQGTSADLQQDISQNSTVTIQLNITGP